MLIKSEGRRGFHLQQPINLLERDSVAFGENFVDDGSNISSMFKGPKGMYEGSGTYFTR